MAFCYFDNEASKEGYVLLDSLFIQHYLPYAAAAEIKVYLYGLDLCTKFAENTDINRVASDLNLTEEQVKDAFEYWEEQGIVNVISKSPYSVRYLSVRQRFGMARIFKKERYADFNKQIEALFPDRLVTPQEFRDYYTVMEDGKLDPDAMVLIIKYCLGYCSKDNPVRYVRKVATSWIDAGVRTAQDVEKRLLKEEEVSSDLRAVLFALGKTSAPEPVDRQLYVKWTMQLGFTNNAILAAAKTCKKRGGTAKLDTVLENFIKLGVYSQEDIEAHAQRRDDMFDLAIRINNKLGLFYQSLDNVLEVYISPWTNKGYTAESLLMIADRCFVDDNRTLSGMDRMVNEFFEAGYVTTESVRARVKEMQRLDSNIEKIIRATGSNRKVRDGDRELYRNWTMRWGFDENTVMAAAGMAVGKPYATSYINQVLSKWKETGVTGVPLGAIKELAATKTNLAANLYDDNLWSEEERKTKLMNDKIYKNMEKERRKLSIEIAKIISEGETPDVEKSMRYDELEKALKVRMEELGLTN